MSIKIQKIKKLKIYGWSIHQPGWPTHPAFQPDKQTVKDHPRSKLFYFILFFWPT